MGASEHGGFLESTVVADNGCGEQINGDGEEAQMQESEGLHWRDRCWLSGSFGYGRVGLSVSPRFCLTGRAGWATRLRQARVCRGALQKASSAVSPKGGQAVLVGADGDFCCDIGSSEFGCRVVGGRS